MSLEAIPSQLGVGGSNLTDGTLRKILQQVQGITTTVVAGAAADTDIALAGVEATGTLQSVIMYNGGVPSDVTADASITEADVIQLTSDSSGNTLVVTYFPA